jgi:hypothetical protein
MRRLAMLPLLALAACEEPPRDIVYVAAQPTDDPCIVSLTWRRRSDMPTLPRHRTVSARLMTPECAEAR